MFYPSLIDDRVHILCFTCDCQSYMYDPEAGVCNLKRVRIENGQCREYRKKDETKGSDK